MSTTTGQRGRLILVPNTLDFGIEGEAVDLRLVIPDEVLRCAASLQHWAAENAKTTRAFLKRVDAIHALARPLQEIQIQELPRPPKGGKPGTGEDAVWQGLLAPALAGHDVGLISEAGLPAVADPGARLVALAHQAGIVVLPLSGPSSLLMTLAASGLNGQSFAFVGYLPVDGGARTTRLKELEQLSQRFQQTQLMIETPYRNEALLDAMLSTLRPETRLTLSCGLTLAQGFSCSGTVAQWRKMRPALPDKVPAVFGLLA